MRLFVFVLLGIITLFESALAYIDAAVRTNLDVFANAWADSCIPRGCIPELTLDNDLGDESRWSCAKYLKDETCKICYVLAEPQDIIILGVAFYKGDERTRTVKMTAYQDYDDNFIIPYQDDDDDPSTSSYVFTSSGNTMNYEYFYVGTDQTKLLCMEPVGLDDDEWLSVLEMAMLVQ